MLTLSFFCDQASFTWVESPSIGHPLQRRLWQKQNSNMQTPHQRLPLSNSPSLLSVRFPSPLLLDLSPSSLSSLSSLTPPNIPFLSFVSDETLKDRLSNFASSLHLLIWTTTPWTLPANQAICAASDSLYQIVCDPNGDFLILSEKLLPSINKELGLDLQPLLSEPITGKDLQGIVYKQILLANDPDAPLNPSPTPDLRKVWIGDHVSDDAGTGLVHTAPGHGLEDFGWSIKASPNDPTLFPISPVDDNGFFTDAVFEPFRKLSVLTDGTQKIVEWLSSHNLLLGSHKYHHRVCSPLPLPLPL